MLSSESAVRGVVEAASAAAPAQSCCGVVAAVASDAPFSIWLNDTGAEGRNGNAAAPPAARPTI
jgi:hypothetical protein